jgi:hypothetical protein
MAFQTSVSAIQFEEDGIWGVTADILRDLCERIYKDRQHSGGSRISKLALRASHSLLHGSSRPPFADRAKW